MMSFPVVQLTVQSPSSLVVSLTLTVGACGVSNGLFPWTSSSSSDSTVPFTRIINVVTRVSYVDAPVSFRELSSRMLHPLLPPSRSSVVPLRPTPEPPPSRRTAYRVFAWSVVSSGATNSLSPAARLSGPASSATSAQLDPSQRRRVAAGGSMSALPLENLISRPSRIAFSTPTVNSWSRTASDSDRSVLSDKSMLLTSASARAGAPASPTSAPSVISVMAPKALLERPMARRLAARDRGASPQESPIANETAGGHRQSKQRVVVLTARLKATVRAIGDQPSNGPALQIDRRQRRG